MTIGGSGGTDPNKGNTGSKGSSHRRFQNPTDLGMSITTVGTGAWEELDDDGSSGRHSTQQTSVHVEYELKEFSDQKTESTENLRSRSTAVGVSGY